MAVSQDARSLLERVLSKKLVPQDVPSIDHFTLQVTAYWRDDYLDSFQAGRKKKIVVGGYHANRRADLQVEMPEGLKRFTLAHIRGNQARIVIPEGAEIGVRRADGSLDFAPSLQTTKAPFPANALDLMFEERVAFSLQTLSFLLLFVKDAGLPRKPFDWLMPGR